MQEESGKPKARVVLDSNVIISGLNSPVGAPRQILDLLHNRGVEVVISTFILEEVAKSLGEDFGWSELRIQTATALLYVECSLIRTTQEASVTELTLADNRILDCAVQGQVQYLVTGDRGIQHLREYRGIRIVSPAELLQALRSSGGIS